MNQEEARVLQLAATLRTERILTKSWLRTSIANVPSKWPAVAKWLSITASINLKTPGKGVQRPDVDEAKMSPYEDFTRI